MQNNLIGVLSLTIGEYSYGLGYQSWNASLIRLVIQRVLCLNKKSFITRLGILPECVHFGSMETAIEQVFTVQFYVYKVDIKLVEGYMFEGTLQRIASFFPSHLVAFFRIDLSLF